MKRTPIKRRSKPRRTAAEYEAMNVFKFSCDDRPCAVCGAWPWWGSEAHHVVYRQHCPPGLEWDVRNALPLCTGCHGRHHDGSDFKIPLDCLTATNLEFADEAKGAAARDYLFRRYGGSVGDVNGAATE